MAMKLITAPTILPVTLAEAKLHLRVDHSYEDAAIEDIYLKGAVDYVDGWRGFLGRALIDQTWELTIDAFPTNEIEIPLPPLLEVVSVKYDDSAGVEQTLDPSSYTVDDESEPGWILPEDSWPSTFDGINAVRIRFRAGYVDTSVSPPVGEVPADIKNAILLFCGDAYRDRESIMVGTSAMKMPRSAEDLLRRRQIYVGFS